MNKTLCPLLLLTLCVPLACSVKEDRSECPVYVTVLTDRFLQQGMDEGIISFSGAELIRQEQISFISYIRDGYEQACPRRHARAAVIAGAENSQLSGETLTVPQGRASGLVWAYSTSFSADCDEYVVDAVPHKQHCRIRFLFDESTQAPDDYPWRFRLRAECAGFNIYTLSPVEGPYVATVGPDAMGEWIGVLPRQKTNNMLLELYIPDGENPDTGRTDYVLDLGEAFERQGYDWRAEDLRDIEVQVGYSQTEVSMTIREWEGDDSYSDIEI